MTQDERRVAIVTMVANLKWQLETNQELDTKMLANLTDMRRAFNESD